MFRIWLSLVYMGLGCLRPSDDIVDQTAAAIEAYDSSLRSLQLTCRVVFGPSEGYEEQTYAEDSQGRRAYESWVFGPRGPLSHSAAYYDGKQGYQVLYDDGRPTRMLAVSIDNSWAGDGGLVPPAHPLKTVRWFGRGQSGRAFSTVLRGVSGVRGSGSEISIPEGTGGRVSTTVVPAPEYGHILREVTYYCEDGAKVVWKAEEFRFTAGRWFPVRGKTSSHGGPLHYDQTWEVTRLAIDEPIDPLVFQPRLDQPGLRIRNNVTGQSYTVPGGDTTAQRPDGVIPLEPTGNVQVPAQPSQSRLVTVCAYVLGTLSLTLLAICLLYRFGFNV